MSNSEKPTLANQQAQLVRMQGQIDAVCKEVTRMMAADALNRQGEIERERLYRRLPAPRPQEIRIEGIDAVFIGYAALVGATVATAAIALGYIIWRLA